MDFNHNIIVSYVSEFPLKGDSPKVVVESDSDETFKVDFIDKEKRELVNTVKVKANEIAFGGRQWYTDWLINVYDESGKLIYIETFNVYGKSVFIKIDAIALGDNISWMPYIEEFRKKHNCNIICSTFYNYIFEKSYPEILFIKPNSQIRNIYAQYYIGANFDDNYAYSPVNVKKVPLQLVSSSSLGMEHKELRPDLTKSFNKNSVPKIRGKYVCISEYSSDDEKMWKEVGGWEKIVKFLRKKGYIVVSVSKEKSTLKNVINTSGDGDLKDRMLDLYHAEFYIGVSSGLAWLSWSVGTHVFMISDCTPPWHEFSQNITRFCVNKLDSVDFSKEKFTSSNDVLYHLNQFIERS